MIKKLFAIALALSISSWAMAPSVSAALTDSQVQSILDLLESFGADSATIDNVESALTGGPVTPATGGWCHNFSYNLQYGDVGSEVEALQKALGREGFAIASSETEADYFGDFTASAVVRFQEKHSGEILSPWGLASGTGYVGKTTLARLNSAYGCNTGVSVGPRLSSPSVDAKSFVATSSGDYYDDFNDNEKDFTKWSEWETNGEWWERNGRAEFQLFESEHNTREGIESKNISLNLSTSTPAIFSADMITDISHTSGQYVGRIILEVTDGEEWIRAIYSRGFNELRFQDSNDGDYSVLKRNQGEGSFNAEIKVYSDGYSVKMNSYNSGRKSDVLFSSSTNLKVRLYILLAGDYPDYYWRAGFDNVDISKETEIGEDIEGQYITVTSPNGGEVFEKGQDIPVTWESKGINNVYIYAYYYDENGNLGDPGISGFTFNGGECRLTYDPVSAITGKYIIKDGGSGRCGKMPPGNRIKIEIKEQGTAIKDQSDNYFIIEEELDCNDPDCTCYTCNEDTRIGDISGNGVIDFQDSGIIYRISLGQLGITGDICCADVDNDGDIDEDDSTLVWENRDGVEEACFPRGYTCSIKEHCSNQKDDDCDGLIDCDDPDCIDNSDCTQ